MPPLAWTLALIRKAALKARPLVPSKPPQFAETANFSDGSSHGVPAIAKAMATPLIALLLRPARSFSRALIELMSPAEASPSPASELVARLPPASEVTIWVGPAWAALLAAEAMPAIV